MKTEHKYAQVLRWIADGEQIQWYGWGGQWHPIEHDTIMKALSGEDAAPPEHFRLKSSTITVNGREVQAPETVEPEGYFFIADPAHDDLCISAIWRKDFQKKIALQRGLVHLTKENAIAHAKAMLGID